MTPAGELDLTAVHPARRHGPRRPVHRRAPVAGRGAHRPAPRAGAAAGVRRQLVHRPAAAGARRRLALRRLRRRRAHRRARCRPACSSCIPVHFGAVPGLITSGRIPSTSCSPRSARPVPDGEPLARPRRRLRRPGHRRRPASTLAELNPHVPVHVRRHRRRRRSARGVVHDDRPLIEVERRAPLPEDEAIAGAHRRPDPRRRHDPVRHRRHARRRARRAPRPPPPRRPLRHPQRRVRRPRRRRRRHQRAQGDRHRRQRDRCAARHDPPLRLGSREPGAVDAGGDVHPRRHRARRAAGRCTPSTRRSRSTSPARSTASRRPVATSGWSAGRARSPAPR